MAFTHYSPYQGAQMQYTVTLPLWERCRQWEQSLCCTTSVVDEAQRIAELLVELFSTPAYNLLSITDLNGSDCSYVRQFLSPSGLLANRMLYLTGSTQVKIDLPIVKLLGLAQNLPQLSTSPNVSGSLMMTDPSVNSKPSQILTVNPLEYFFYCFCSHLLETNGYNPTARQPQNFECAYTIILQDWLDYVLPILEEQTWEASLGPSSPSPALGVGSPKLDHFRSPFNLFKRSFLEQAPTSSVAISYDSKAADVWKLDTFLRIVSELWLVGPLSSTRKCLPTSSVSQLPSIVQVVIVRALVKHCHRYSYKSTPYAKYSANRTGAQRLASISCIQKWIERYLFRYLSVCFARWPLDASFQSVLELWLSYIQPWRYAGFETYEPLSSNDIWMKFISEKFVFYATFFRSCVERLLRCDLCSTRGSQMAFRLAKVFSASLVDAMLEVQMDMNARKISVSFNLAPEEQDFGGKTCLKTSFLDDEERCLLRNFLNILQSSMAICSNNINALNAVSRERAERQSLIDRFFSWFSLPENNSQHEELEFRKALDQLRFAATSLSDALRIPLSTNHERLQQTTSFSGPPLHSNAFTLPRLQQVPSTIDNDPLLMLSASPMRSGGVSPEKSSFGTSGGGSPLKFGGAGAFDVSDLTDIAPLRNDELPFLARFLFSLAQDINARYHDTFSRWYNEENTLKGRLARRILLKPCHVTLTRRPLDLPARLNLRKFAKYRTIFWSLFLVVLMKLVFSWNPVLSLFAIAAGYCVLMFVSVLCVDVKRAGGKEKIKIH